MLSSSHPCITPRRCPNRFKVTLKYLPSSVAAADPPFIHFFQSTAELPLLPRRRQARRGNHTKVCDGKTCAGLAQNLTATINAQLEVIYEPGTRRAEKLSDATAEWVYRRALSHRRRRRAIAAILRDGLWRCHSEQRRQQRSTGVHPNRESVAPCYPRGRSDTRQPICNAERPRRSRFGQ